MVRPIRTILALAAIAPIAVVAGCGSSSSSSAAPTTAAATTPAATTPAATTPAAPAATTVAVTADPSGKLAYVEKSLSAKAGAITFEFTNDSPLPHNVTFEKADTEKEQGGTSTITGSKTSVTLTLPAGSYNYYCSVPGHEAAGMKGTLTVS
jgi:plastocyanin